MFLDNSSKCIKSKTDQEEVDIKDDVDELKEKSSDELDHKVNKGSAFKKHVTGIIRLMENVLKHHVFEKGDVKFLMNIKRKVKHVNNFEKEAEDDELKPYFMNACDMLCAFISFEETLKETISDIDANEK